MSEEVEVLTMEDLLASLVDQVSHLAYGGDPDDTGVRQIPAAEVIQWAVAEIAKLRRHVATDVEREAMNDAIYLCGATAGLANEQPNANAWSACAATLQGFLERTKWTQPTS